MKWATDHNGRRYPLMDDYEEAEAERREDESQEREYERKEEEACLIFQSERLRRG